MELDPRRRFTDTKTKENKRKRKQTKKNKTKQNKTKHQHKVHDFTRQFFLHATCLVIFVTFEKSAEIIFKNEQKKSSFSKPKIKANNSTIYRSVFCSEFLPTSGLHQGEENFLYQNQMLPHAPFEFNDLTSQG